MYRLYIYTNTHTHTRKTGSSYLQYTKYLSYMYLSYTVPPTAEVAAMNVCKIIGSWIH